MRQVHKLRWGLARGSSEEAIANRKTYADVVKENLSRERGGSVNAAVGVPRTPMKWGPLSKCITDAAEQTVGRQPRAQDIPFLAEARSEVLASKTRTAESYSQVQCARGKENYLAEKARHAKVKSEARSFERKSKQDVLKRICGDLEWATQNGEVGKQYGLLRELGVFMRGSVLEAESVKPEDCKDHFLKIGGEKNDPEEDLVTTMIQEEVQEYLADSPTREEYSQAVKGMKESSAGDDEVTISMIQLGPKELDDEVYALVCELWEEGVSGRAETSPDFWDERVHRAIVLMLYKKKGDRTELDNYRGICLLTIISRIVARIMSTRLYAWGEKTGRFHTCQWGF